MTRNYLCISIPEELQKFTKVVTFSDSYCETEKIKKDFGVKILKDDSGNEVGTAYYSESGELIKKIIYHGSAVASIEHYRNNKLYSKENYDGGKLSRKRLYTPCGNLSATINYKYNSKEHITSIQKIADNLRYLVEYGYDELMRVNSRVLKINDKIINEQYYKYDILDRIVEYRDCNQQIIVHKVNQNNELVSYSITDAIGNRIIINNKYMCTDYIGTEITLNEHKTTIKDKSYVNNLMLKKPFTSEDDLDFALTNLINVPKISSPEHFSTRREHQLSTEELIDNIIRSKEFETPPPMSADKIKTLKF